MLRESPCKNQHWKAFWRDTIVPCCPRKTIERGTHHHCKQWPIWSHVRQQYYCRESWCSWCIGNLCYCNKSIQSEPWKNSKEKIERSIEVLILFWICFFNLYIHWILTTPSNTHISRIFQKHYNILIKSQNPNFFLNIQTLCRLYAKQCWHHSTNWFSIPLWPGNAWTHKFAF